MRSLSSVGLAVLVGLTTVTALSNPLMAQKRVALVIGNSKYQHTTALANPTSDARKMALALRNIGIGRVELKLDLTFAEMRQVLRNFNAEARAAEMAVVFFAGHGMEFGGKTFLVPTDARLASEKDLEWEVVPLDLVLTSVEPSQFQLVILDACRDNPLAAHMATGRGAVPGLGGAAAGSNAKGATRSVGPGLADVQPRGNNTLIAYAAKHGSYALDGTGENSPYTQALLDHIEEPGVEIRILFGMVRDNVMSRTNGQQEPFVYGSVGGRQLYLVPPRVQATAPLGGAQERQMWETIQGKNAKELYELYLQLYPQGSYAGEARQRLAALNLPAQRPAPTFQGEIVIATVGPMTGQQAAFGGQLRAGSEMAVADINAAGGVLGRRLELVVADDRGDPKEGVAVATQLAARKVAFVAGHFNSAISIPASDVYEREGIIMISPASSNPRLTERGLRNIFRVSSRDDQQGAYAAQYLVRNHRDKRIAIVHDKTTYGQGMADDFRGAIGRAGKKEVLYEGHNYRIDKDHGPIIAKLKQADPDILFMGGLGDTLSVIVRQMRAEGMKTLFVGGDGLADNEFWSNAGSAGEGTLFTSLPDARRFLEASAVVKRFRDRGIEPDGYTLHAYVSVQAWAEAAQRAGSTAAADVAQMLVKGRFTTALGTLGFDPRGDVTIPGFAMYRWSAGKYSQLD
jgi:branched-chain amino acid transport system substrate-binding protein